MGAVNSNNTEFDIILTLKAIEERFHPEINEKLEKLGSDLGYQQLNEANREAVERSIAIFNAMRDDLVIHFKNEEEKYFPLFRLIEGDFFKKRRDIKNALSEFEFEHDMLGENFFDKQLEVVDLILPVESGDDFTEIRNEIKELERLILSHLKMEIAVGDKIKEKLNEMEKLKND
ncbi:MAG: hemerythrin domain-containing protein [Planctomycetota bacterium]|jgi:iron-sulfur cluster repair protein YtfE (RIC family)